MRYTVCFVALVILNAVPAGAQTLDCHAIEQLDPANLSRDTEEGAAWSADDLRQLEQDKQECRRLGVSARTRLQTEFSIDTKGMRDSVAISRLTQELAEQERTAQAAKKARIDAQVGQLERNARSMQAGSEAAIQRQDEMLRPLGTSVEALGVPGPDASDEEFDAAELRMYQQMIDNGLAPGCRGRQGQELITCVDEALGE